MSLSGRTALVTAASSGIGKGVAERLAAEGASVFVGGYEEDLVAAVGEQIGAAGHGRVDFASVDDTEAFIAAARAALGRIDILVVNTGGPPAGQFQQLTMDDWERSYRLILDSAIRLTRAALPGMQESGYGRLIYLTSSSVVRSLPLLHLSNVMRAGVDALAHSLVEEVGPYGITTHVLAPAHIDTARRRQMTEHRAKAKGISVDELNEIELATVPVGRWGRAEDLAALVAFLCSAEAGYLTGQTHRVDGGFTHVTPL